MISIITTAYKNDNFIFETLQSIEEASKDYEYEILLGVDNCELTLKSLIKNKNTLPKNIKIFFFPSHVGTYIIRNSLVQNSKYENIIFFDSDDVMRNDLVTNTIQDLKNYDFVKFSFTTFHNKLIMSKTKDINVDRKYCEGAFGINKKIFEKMNGFEPWICAADGEFFWRIKANNFKIKYQDKLGFFYRRHNNNLTSGVETGMNSDLRKKYHLIRNSKISTNNIFPLKKMNIAYSIQLNTNDINKIEEHDIFNFFSTKKLSIIIPTYNMPQYLEECLNSILQSIKNLNCEILVGLDNCKKTKDYFDDKHLDLRIRFFYFDTNNGPYVLKNSLAKIANSELLLFFDSDDIMKSNMISDIMYHMEISDFCKPMYVDFNDSQNINEITITQTNKYGEGVFSIKKNIFIEMNGFEGWRCAADSDFMNRLYKNNRKYSFTKEINFFRRIHKNSLTQSSNTSGGSELRAKYYGISSNRKNFNPLPQLITNHFYEIPLNRFQIELPKDDTHHKTNRLKLLNELINGSSKESKTVDYSSLSGILNKESYNPQVSNKIRVNTPNKEKEFFNLKDDSNSRTTQQLSNIKPNRRKNSPNIFGSKKK